MKMKSRLATLLVALASTGPLLSATEVERLRALCAEQEMQIRQLELKIARLTDTPPPSRNISADTASKTPPVREQATYLVKPGDSVERIAKRHGVSVSSLNKLNGLKSDSIIHPGQKLTLPGTNGTASGAAEYAPVVAETRKHTIQSGETYYKISMKYGVSVDDLIAANPDVNHRALRVGQKINVSTPAKQAAKPSSAPSLASAPSIPISNTPAPVEKPRASDKPVRINKEITYGQFARNHGTTTTRLDELNGLELDPSTILAQGSELYIPAQP